MDRLNQQRAEVVRFFKVENGDPQVLALASARTAQSFVEAGSLLYENRQPRRNLGSWGFDRFSGNCCTGFPKRFQYGVDILLFSEGTQQIALQSDHWLAVVRFPIAIGQ